MKRYEKLLLEAEKGITFETSEETSGEFNLSLQVVSVGEYAEILSVYTDNDGNKAVVPPGWTVSGVCKENTIWGKDVSLVIYRIPKEKVSGINWGDIDVVEGLKRTYNQFVWVPVGLLDANGTLDGDSFNEKFGRRNYRNNVFSKGKFHEPLTEELALQAESVEKYGGFYISRYDISKNKKTGEPQSVKGEEPWTNINFPDAKQVASTIEDNGAVKCHQTFGAEYDSVLEWFIKSKARTLNEIAKDSTQWGNYYNTKTYSVKALKTGSIEEYCVNNIYDFAGNVDEWTQEQCGDSYSVIRGGSCGFSGNDCPVAYRRSMVLEFDYYITGFRATLYIK